MLNFNIKAWDYEFSKLSTVVCCDWDGTGNEIEIISATLLPDDGGDHYKVYPSPDYGDDIEFLEVLTSYGAKPNHLFMGAIIDLSETIIGYGFSDMITDDAHILWKNQHNWFLYNTREGLVDPVFNFDSCGDIDLYSSIVKQAKIIGNIFKGIDGLNIDKFIKSHVDVDIINKMEV